MKKLYLRIYLAVLASLIVFAVAAGLLWRQLGLGGPQSEIAATLAQNALPPAGAPRAEQQLGLERLAANLRVDAALYGADREPPAAVGKALPVPESAGWAHRWGAPPAWAAQLPDGRWLVARPPPQHRHPALGLFLMLGLIAAAVAAGAYPVVRRLAARIERLQAGVESLGAGDLAARVKVEGKDEIGRLAQSFNLAAARIEALVGAHKSLLANASHELRTPLARIRMAVELMQQDADPARKRELEQDITELDVLIEEILLASRLDSSSAPERTEEVDLLGLAAEECARYEEIDLEGEPVVVRGDPRLLRRLIRNLLENARRHGQPPVRVSVTVTVTAAASFVELRVCDRGPGVPEAEREQVFEPFYRRRGAAEGVGAGLGLALVRQIARRHGGGAVCNGNCFKATLSR